MDVRHVGRWRPRAALAGMAFLAVLTQTGASFRTENFVVEAPTEAIARQVATQAEAYRKSIAVAWLGAEMPAWQRPCPIKVKLTAGEAGGLTTFGFRGGGVSSQEMEVEGRLDRILASALPHEVTHTVFAAHFGAPMPRWADEGACLLSEDDLELERHEQIVDNLLSRKGEFPLDQLFTLEEYPRDLMGFYGQGYSVSRFLVEIGGRGRFLDFVRDGMSETGWNSASRDHYGLANCRELHRAWMAWYQVTSRDSTRGATVIGARVVGNGAGAQ